MLVSDRPKVHARTCIRIKYKYEIRLRIGTSFGLSINSKTNFGSIPGPIHTINFDVNLAGLWSSLLHCLRIFRPRLRGKYWILFAAVFSSRGHYYHLIFSFLCTGRNDDIQNISTHH